MRLSVHLLSFNMGKKEEEVGIDLENKISSLGLIAY